MRKISIYIFLLLTVSLFGCSKKSSKADSDTNTGNNTQVSNVETSSASSSDQNAPDFSLIDTKGKKISLSDFKGKVVILDFWATWCPPCRRGIPDLISIKKQYKNKIAIVGISLDTDSKSEVVPFAKKYGINYHIVYGTNKVVHDYGNIEAIPTSFIINQKGEIVNRHVGLTPKEVYLSEINKLLGNS